jgi:hypothetical protein
MPWRTRINKNELAADTTGTRRFDGLRAGKPTVIADGNVRANCGPQALIAAITVIAIRAVLKTREADHA